MGVREEGRVIWDEGSSQGSRVDSRNQADSLLWVVITKGQFQVR